MGSTLSEPISAIVVDRARAKSWTSSASTMQGWRKTHEDAHIFNCGVDENGNSKDFACFAVLDGHGGQLAARRGAVLLGEKLDMLASKGVPVDVAASECAIRAAFLDTDILLRNLVSDNSGSTVVACIITQGLHGDLCVQLAHSGDSRAVIFRGGEVLATEDHKPDREDESARIQAAGGSVAPGVLGGPMRVDGALAVSRALGDFSFKPLDMSPELCKVTALPDVQTISDCKPGDWLMLCCDGVFDVFSNDELKEFVCEHMSQDVDDGDICRLVLQASLQRGSKDNCTALFVRFHSHDDAKPLQKCRRELFEGHGRSCCQEVREQYASFMESEGFLDEAASFRRDLPSQKGDAESGIRGGGSESSEGNQRVVAMAKAIKAMKGSRAIQAAWRKKLETKREIARDQASDVSDRNELSSDEQETQIGK